MEDEPPHPVCEMNWVRGSVGEADGEDVDMDERDTQEDEIREIRHQTETERPRKNTGISRNILFRFSRL